MDWAWTETLSAKKRTAERSMLLMARDVNARTNTAMAKGFHHEDHGPLSGNLKTRCNAIVSLQETYEIRTRQKAVGSDSKYPLRTCRNLPPYHRPTENIGHCYCALSMH